MHWVTSVEIEDNIVYSYLRFIIYINDTNVCFVLETHPKSKHKGRSMDVGEGKNGPHY